MKKERSIALTYQVPGTTSFGGSASQGEVGSAITYQNLYAIRFTA